MLRSRTYEASINKDLSVQKGIWNMEVKFIYTRILHERHLIGNHWCLHGGKSYASENTEEEKRAKNRTMRNNNF